MVDMDVVKFKYPVIVPVYFRYRWAVENHNTLRCDGVIKYKIGLYI